MIIFKWKKYLFLLYLKSKINFIYVFLNKKIKNYH